MPDENSKDEEQINSEVNESSTPHFDAFSGKNNDEVAEDIDAKLPEETPSIKTTSTQNEPSLESNKPEEAVSMDEQTSDIESNLSNESEQSPEVADDTPLMESKINEPTVINGTVPKPSPTTSSFASEPVVNNEQPVTSSSEMPQNQPIQSTQLSEKKNFFKNKKAIIIVAIILLIILLGAGSVLAYNLYQTPKKVLADAVINTLNVKNSVVDGKLTFTTSSQGSSANTKIEMTYNAKVSDGAGSADVDLKFTFGTTSLSMKSSAIYDSNGDLYIKMSGIKTLVANLKTSYGFSLDKTASNAIDKIVSKIDGTWIKISPDDMKEYSQQYSTTQKCINDAVNKYKSDQGVVKEITDLYEKNQFIIIDKELGEKDGSFGYQLDVDYDLGKSFSSGLKSTEIFKDLKKCSGDSSYDDEINIEKPSSLTDDSSKTINKIWVDKWSHQITKYEMSVNSKSGYTNTAAEFTMSPKFNENVTVSVPKDSVTLTELKNNIEEIMTSIFSSSYYSYDL